MQDKMATRNRAVNAIYSASFAAWFPLFRALTRVLSRATLFALARQTIGRFFAPFGAKTSYFSGFTPGLA